MLALVEREVVATRLKRVTVVLDPALQSALESYALRSRRSQSNAASILLEQALIVTGDLPGPVDRSETRGGKRPNSGRKPKTESDRPSTDEATEGGEGDG